MTPTDFRTLVRATIEPPQGLLPMPVDLQVAAIGAGAEELAAWYLEQASRGNRWTVDRGPVYLEPLAPADAEAVASAIKSQRYRYADEIQLQDGIAGVLAGAGIPAVREVSLTAADKIDFMAGRLGIEVKIAGQAAAVQRQLCRYAASAEVDELMLVTTRSAHRSVRRELAGKTVHVVLLSGVAS